MSSENLEIIVGTYEEFLLGYQVQKTKNEELNLVQSFANHSHLGSIRCVASSGRFLASGAADEAIRLYDLVERKESGVLMHHNGTVTALEFSPNGSHLISCSEDGSIAVCRTGNWNLEKLWGSAHKGSGVTCLSIHPSGKLALSVGTDATLRTWNLIKGRQAYATNLGKHPQGRLINSVLWSPCGNRYLILTASKLDIYSVATAGIESSIQPDKRMCSAYFLNPTLLCIGTEDGYLLLYQLESGKSISLNQISAHDTTRVKTLHSIIVDENNWLASGSSDGEIKLWKIQGEDLVNVCSIKTGCRITCLTVLDPKIRLRSAAVEEAKLDKMEKKNDDYTTDIQNSINKKALIQSGVVVTEVEKVKTKKKKKKNKSINNSDETSVKNNTVCNDAEYQCADSVKHTENRHKKLKIEHPVTSSKLEKNKNIKLQKKNKIKYSVVSTRASGEWCVENT